MKKMLFLILAFSLNCYLLKAQTEQPTFDLLGKGITLEGGVGYAGIKDNYISAEKYEGKVSSFATSWTHSNLSSGYRLSFDYLGSSNIKNHNISSDVLQGGLSLDYMYSVGKFNLLRKEVYAYVGPSPDLFVYYRKQQIASGGNAMFDAYSFALFMSMGVNSTFVMPLSSKLFIENSDKVALFSIGGRLADINDKRSSFFKPTTALSGVRGYSQILIRYDLNKTLSLKTGYKFNICQSSSWDYLISVSDNFIIALTVRL